MSPELEQTLGTAEWLVAHAEQATGRGEFDQALTCIGFASRVLSRQNRLLMHPRIEATLHAIGKETFRDEPRWTPPASGAVVHVLTNALGHGGHTAMALRWMLADARPGVHSAALVQQRVPVPDALSSATAAKGGQVFQPPSGLGGIERARWLRSLVRREARLVVLHVDMDDAASIVAFAAEDGPPVMIVNHAGHIYWTGASVADLILNCRSSELEVDWTRLYRSPRSGILPIPLVEPNLGSVTPHALRDEWRAKLGLGPDAVMLLTVGDTYKYTPLPRYNLDFRQSALRVLERAPQAHLFVVGARDDGGWAAVAGKTGGRLTVTGRQPDVHPFYRAADVCVESFPFGSTTSLFEAGLSGLPVVLTPEQAPPPFGTDGIAVDGVLERPASLNAFEDAIVRLATDAAERRKISSVFGQSIRRHHLGEGWQEHLRQAEASLPERHGVYLSPSAVPTPPTLHEFWTTMRELCWKADWPDMSAFALPQYYVRALVQAGINPKISRDLVKASAGVRRERRGNGVPLTLLKVFTNVAYPMVDTARRASALASLETLFRPGSKTSELSRRLLPASWW